MSIQRDRRAEHIGAAAILALPEAVAQHRDRSMAPAAAPVVVCGEGAADVRHDAKHVEESAADVHAADGTQFAARVQIEPSAALGEDAAEEVLMIAQYSNCGFVNAVRICLKASDGGCESRIKRWGS